MSARRTIRGTLAGLCGLALIATLPAAGTAAPPVQAPAPQVAPVRYTDKNPTAYGTGGAVSSVDPEATQAGLQVLRRGGNAVDAAVATAAALGVTEPYSAGIGGGGYFVYYDAKTGRVSTLDGRETAPASIPDDAFVDPATGRPYAFADLVSSGVSVGVPGTPATWDSALRRWGSLSLEQALRPATRIAERGFVVDETFRGQTRDNQARFRQFTTTADLFLPGGELPEVGSIFTNPDLARTYETLGDRGVRSFYRGGIARDIVSTVQDPPTVANPTLPVPTGYLQASDLADYRVLRQRPTHVRYRGLDVYSMAPSSSGGTTVGEALNILQTQKLGRLTREQALHYYLDASSLAFADRNAYVGDPAFVDVPTETLLSRRFARSRACRISPIAALPLPTPPGDLDAAGCGVGTGSGRADTGTSTTHLVTADRWGNVVSYTLTIEQTGGAGIVVPGRGFLLNNELTDFSLVYDADDPNRIEPGKRPRSSMAPTIVLRNGEPALAIGSPGGATIITTVLQTLVNRIDFRQSLPEAVAAPRASARNATPIPAEPAFIDAYGARLTADYGYRFAALGDTFTSASEIGAVAALEFFPRGRIQAVAEATRRGGGDARVVRPRRR